MTSAYDTADASFSIETLMTRPPDNCWEHEPNILSLPLDIRGLLRRGLPDRSDDLQAVDISYNAQLAFASLFGLKILSECLVFLLFYVVVRPRLVRECDLRFCNRFYSILFA
jgi:hypothetical protein